MQILRSLFFISTVFLFSFQTSLSSTLGGGGLFPPDKGDEKSGGSSSSSVVDIDDEVAELVAAGKVTLEDVDLESETPEDDETLREWYAELHGRNSNLIQAIKKMVGAGTRVDTLLAAYKIFGTPELDKDLKTDSVKIKVNGSLTRYKKLVDGIDKAHDAFKAHRLEVLDVEYQKQMKKSERTAAFLRKHYDQNPHNPYIPSEIKSTSSPKIKRASTLAGLKEQVCDLKEKADRFAAANIKAAKWSKDFALVKMKYEDAAHQTAELSVLCEALLEKENSNPLVPLVMKAAEFGATWTLEGAQSALKKLQNRNDGCAIEIQKARAWKPPVTEIVDKGDEKSQETPTSSSSGGSDGGSTATVPTSTTTTTTVTALDDTGSSGGSTGVTDSGGSEDLGGEIISESDGQVETEGGGVG